VLEFCGGEASEIVVAGAPPQWRREIAFAAGHLARLAGIELPANEIIRILTSLGFLVKDGDPLRVSPPSWRGDVAGAADLVEEIVRIHGLENIPSVPMRRPHAVARPVLTLAQRRARTAKRALAARGFNETVNFAFVSRSQAALFEGGDEARQLENPISAELDAMRPSLLASLMAAGARNQARAIGHLMLFEVGAQFASGVPGEQAAIAAGLRAGEPPRHWTKEGARTDFFAVKADVLAALEAAWGPVANMPVQPGAASWYHPGRSATIALGPQKILAQFGELHPRIIRAFALKGPVAGFEIFLDAIPDPKAKGRARAPFEASPFQAVERDFAFLLDAAVPAGEVTRAVKGAAKGAELALIERVDVFDVYEGKGVADGKKSLAISVRLQPKDKTLTDAEIEAIAARIVNAVAKATGGTLRT